MDTPNQDRMLDEFDQSWTPSSRDAIPSKLAALPADGNASTLLELAHIDIERRYRQQLPITLDFYAQAIPLDQGEQRALLNALEQRLVELATSDQTCDNPTRPDTGTADHPEIFGERYRTMDRLAVGGEAEVYLCWDAILKCTATVKWMKPATSGALPTPARFLEQKDLLLRLKDVPSVQRVFDCGECDGRPYIATDFIEGRTLLDYVRDTAEPGSGRIGVARSVRIIAALARTVESVHRLGIVHGDIGPKNVLLDRSDNPVLIDFGMASLRSQWRLNDDSVSTPGGTPQFISPEQAGLLLGQTPLGVSGPRTDVFGLGGSLLFLLTGEGPWPHVQGRSLEELLTTAVKGSNSEHLQQRLRDSLTPGGIARVCVKSLATHPTNRHASAANFANCLEGNVPVRFPTRRDWLIGVGALAGMFALGRRAWLRAPLTGRLAVGITVWNPDRQEYTPLAKALPIASGRAIRVSIRIPAGVYASLFHIDGNGAATLKQQYPRSGEEREEFWPSKDSAITLKPPGGCELILALGNPDRPVTEADLKRGWPDGGWPVPPKSTEFYRLQPETITVTGEGGRDLGDVVPTGDPDPMRTRLDDLRARLLRDYHLFEGIAFRHE